jgi:DNA-directed RNA polymerase subunit alpha
MNLQIKTPKIDSIKSKSPTEATIVISPLEGGYGMTLGNSLRRILLSSIDGAAAIYFKIDGLTHEFNSIKGILEDVVEIMLNIKGLRFKVSSDEIVVLSFSMKGEGIVTGASIKCPAGVEIINQDQHLFTLTEKSSSIDLEIAVRNGRGYILSDENKKLTPSGAIAIDSLYSPMKRVRYNVENTRDGKDYNMDSLTMEIVTDGSITATDAFHQAASILAQQYTVLAGDEAIDSFEKVSPVRSGQNKQETATLEEKIESLELKPRTTKALIDAGIVSVADLVQYGDNELLALGGFGKTALLEVKDKLKELGL